MKINKADLVQVLEKVRPGIATKDDIEQTTCFAFTDGAILSYNDEISVRHPFEIDFEGVVDASTFYGIMQKIAPNDDGEVEVYTTKKQLRVKGRRTTSGLALDPEVRLPLEELGDLKESRWTKLPENFREALKFCLFSAGTDMNRPLLTCIHIGKEQVESCDNYRFTRYWIDGKKIKEPLLIPARAVRSLVNYDIAKYTITEGWIHFKTTDDVVFSTRRYSDQYPETDELYKVRGTKLTLPKGMVDALDRANIFSSKAEHELDNEVKVRIADKKLHITGESANGWVHEELPIRHKGDPINFAINPNFLTQILKQANEATIGEKVLKFSTDQWEHIVMFFADGSE